MGDEGASANVMCEGSGGTDKESETRGEVDGFYLLKAERGRINSVGMCFVVKIWRDCIEY